MLWLFAFDLLMQVEYLIIHKTHVLGRLGLPLLELGLVCLQVLLG